jgi:LmbE family N-acetylglucosaminyl deacetylase
LGTVLGVWAHPDDETYLSGALMVLARRAGSRVVCATATFGEHGTADPANWPPRRLGARRRRELVAALAALGVHELRCFGYEDGTLAGVDTARGRASVAALVAEIAPDTVVTFGPDGMTGHPDHRAVGAWVRGALVKMRRPPVLLEATTLPTFADEFADIHAALPVFDEGLPRRTHDDEIDVVVPLDDELADRKFEALRAHESQLQPLLDAIGEARLREWWRVEAFHRVDLHAREGAGR